MEDEKPNPTNVRKYHPRPLPASLRTLSSQPKTSAKLIKAPRCPGWVAQVEGANSLWKQIASDMAERKAWQAHYENTLARYCVDLAEYQSDPAGTSAAKKAALTRLEGALKLTPESNQRRY